MVSVTRERIAFLAQTNATAALAVAHTALTQSELDALRAKLISLWNPPSAVSTNPERYVITIRIRLTRDHRLTGQPIVLTSGQDPLFAATRDSALRAVFEAQPFDMLGDASYDAWKEIDINFDPREATHQAVEWPAPAQHAPAGPSADTARMLEAVTMQARGCVRSHIVSAYQAGVYGWEQAVAYFKANCGAAFLQAWRNAGQEGLGQMGFELLVIQEIKPEEWQKTVDRYNRAAEQMK
jgi:hypothetical protein